LATVQKHSAHVRELILCYRNSVDYPGDVLLTCPNLTRLRLSIDEDSSTHQTWSVSEVDAPSLYAFVRRHCQTLEEISTELNEDYMVRDRDMVGLMDALVVCPRLTRMVMAHDLVIDNPAWWVGVFESMCSHLKVVSFLSNTYLAPESTMEVATAQWPNFKGPSRIQDLTLSRHGRAVYPIHIWILRQCTDLVRLRWTTECLDHKRMLQDLGNIVRSGRACQRLEDLSLRNLDENMRFPTEEFTGLIKWMAPLVRLDLRGSSFDASAWESLRSMPHHLATLKVLDLSNWLPGRVIHDILCMIPQLTDLKAGVVQDTDIIEDGRDWVCLGMQRLDVSLHITERASHPLILSRLSKLTRLEMIIYHSNWFGEEKQSSRWTRGTESSLAQLQNLRQMRRIEGTFSNKWGVAEMRWALDNWPLLELPLRTDLRKRLERKMEKGGRDVFLSWINS